MKLPPPSRIWALILAGPALTVTGVCMTLIVWRGGWVGLQAKQLDLLGWGMLANWLLLGVVVVSLASVKVKGAGPGGVSFELDSDDGPTDGPATIETKTITTLKPGAPDERT